MKSWLQKKSILLLMITGLLVWLISAWCSDGYYQADEHFQIIEFAQYKLGNNTTADLPWEFGARMRPGFQPLLTFLVIKGAIAVEINNPFIQAFLLRLITIFIAVLALFFFFRRVFEEFTGKSSRVLLIFLLFFLWFLPPLVVRFSSENLSGLMMVLSVTFMMGNKKKDSLMLFLFSGLAAGLAFLFRYQVCVMLAGFILWMIFIRKTAWKHIVIFSIAGLVIAALGILCDRWLYGEWTISFWNYFSNNFIEDKLSGFGIKPWHHYFTSGTEQMALPLGVLIWFCTLMFWITKWRSPLTWLSIPFVFFHIFIPHKEVRFLFPLIYFIPVFIVQTAVFLSKKSIFKKIWLRNSLLAVLLLINIPILVFITPRPMDPYVAVMHHINKFANKPVVLYYLGNNPQNPFGLKLNHYFEPGIKSVSLDSIESQLSLPHWADTTYYLFEEKHGMSVRKPEIFIILDQSHPSWMKMINISGWLDRTTTWSLYQIKPDLLLCPDSLSAQATRISNTAVSKQPVYRKHF